MKLPPRLESLFVARARRQARSLALLLTVLACGAGAVRADTFVYDAAGRLESATQANGLTHRYSCDAEANLLSVGHSSTDTTDSGGAGNGIPDWWEYFYFGMRGVDPLASPAQDGMSNLLKFALGLNPLVSSSASPLSLAFSSFTDGKLYPYVDFVRARDSVAVVFPEQSSDLVTWKSGDTCFAEVSVSDLGDGTEYVVLRGLTCAGPN